MRGVLAFAVIFFLFLIQNAAGFIFFGQDLPLVLLGVLFYALSRGPVFGLALGGAAGGLLEVFGVGRIGYESAIFGGIGFLAGLAAQKVFRDSLWTQILLPVIALYLVTFFNLGNHAFGLSLVREAFLPRDLLITAILSPFVFQILKRFS
ncbi:MAG: hypothetical protein HYZ52_02065 [Candidatus Omnitrophica bacterium]|nr:hypothetical protein [Candidatus Omnitrophota bacterium]